MTAAAADPIVQSDKIILVVDDEKIIRELLCEFLELEGFVTQGEENADLALEFLKHHSGGVGLLLTDINMPGSINGAVLANLSGESWPAIPVIVMSGLESPKSSGVHNDVLFLRKPFTIGQVLDGIRSAFHTSH
jgi:DNA-binding NtrC family response regulator